MYVHYRAGMTVNDLLSGGTIVVTRVTGILTGSEPRIEGIKFGDMHVIRSFDQIAPDAKTLAREEKRAAKRAGR